jgi:pyruvate,water dikinase
VEKKALIWNCSNPREVVPTVVAPLSQDIVMQVVDTAARRFMEQVRVDVPPEPFAAFHYGCYYLNISFVLHTTEQIPFRSGKELMANFGVGEEDTRMIAEVSGKDLDTPTPLKLSNLGTLLLSLWYVMAVPAMLRRQVPDIRRKLVSIRERVSSTETEAELRRLAREALAQTHRATWAHAATSNFAYGQWEQLKRMLPDPDAMSVLLGGLDVPTARMGRSLQELAALIEQEDLERLIEHWPGVDAVRASHPAFAAKLDQFLEEWGHRGFNEIDLANPRFGDDPVSALHLLLPHKKTERGPGLEALRQRREEAESAQQAALPFARRPLFSWLLEQVQFYSVHRETTKDLWILGHSVLRRIFLRLATKSPDIKSEYLFYHRLDELLGTADLPSEEELRRRQAETESFLDVNPPETFVGETYDPETGQAEEKEIPRFSTQLELTGIPCSAGRASGTARILRSPTEAARIHPGDILVTQFTEPAWTPLFPPLAGVVTERGGVVSHAAIVAREFGIPAVAGVRDLLASVQDGDQLVIDGTQGTVTVIRGKREN